MSKDRKHSVSLFDKFKAYLSGQMTSKSRHEFEKNLLDDDFEAEAMSGFENFQADDLEKDLGEISARLNQKNKTSTFAYWKIAAVITLFVAATISIFYLARPGESSKMVNESPQEKAESTKADSILEKIENQGLDTPRLLSQKLETPNIQPQSSAHKNTEETQESGFFENEVANEALSEVEIPEPVDEIAIEKRDIELPSTSPIKEIQLEPLPDKGELSRVVTADVPPSEDDQINKGNLDLPSTIMYDEGIKEKPDNIQSESRSFARDQNKRTERAKKSATPSAAYAVEEKDFETEKSTTAVPDLGIEAYKNYLKENISFQLGSDALHLVLLISEGGEIKNIEIENGISRKQRKEIEQIITDGPMWNAAKKKGIPIDQEVEIVIEF